MHSVWREGDRAADLTPKEIRYVFQVNLLLIDRVLIVFPRDPLSILTFN